MTDEIQKARSALSGIPDMADAARTAQITRLGGLTNLVFEVTANGSRHCLRLPGAGTETYIDRAVEKVNANAAAVAGVAPQVVHFGEDGVMLTSFVSAVTMSASAFRERDGAVERAARALRQLHETAPQFAVRFELFRMVDDYLLVLNSLGSALPVGYDDIVAEAGVVGEALASQPIELCPCHCDPLCENFLDTGERMWIVDWEYSGMNDPMWDLGDLSVEGGFDEAMDKRLIEAYFEGEASAFDHGRMVTYKAMCDLLWTLWGLIQHANKNPSDDFWAYSLNRFERCKQLMRSSDFRRHLDAVRLGSVG